MTGLQTDMGARLKSLVALGASAGVVSFWGPWHDAVN